MQGTEKGKGKGTPTFMSRKKSYLLLRGLRPAGWGLGGGRVTGVGQGGGGGGPQRYGKKRELDAEEHSHIF